MSERVEVGYQAFVADGGEEFGAVRQVLPDSLVIYVENAGDFAVPRTAIVKVHYQKVIFDGERLERRPPDAIRPAHDAEDLGGGRGRGHRPRPRGRGAWGLT